MSTATTRKRLSPAELIKRKFSEEQQKECREAFEMYDADSDAMLTTKELIPALRALGYNPNAVVLEKIAEMDMESADGAAKLDYDAFLGFVAAQLRYAFTSNDMLRDFKAIDVNNDGHITKLELRTYLEKLKVPFSDDEIDEIVNGADLNNDGVIDYSEFILMMCPDEPLGL